MHKNVNKVYSWENMAPPRGGQRFGVSEALHKVFVSKRFYSPIFNHVCQTDRSGLRVGDITAATVRSIVALGVNKNSTNVVCGSSSLHSLCSRFSHQTQTTEQK